MKKTIQRPPIFFVSAAAIFFTFIISCNKSSSPGSTTFKCVTCGSGGACINDTCHCYYGFEGTNCATETREKFLNSWQVMEKGAFIDTVYYTLEVEPDTGITKVLIRGLFSPVTSLTVTGNISRDSLIIPVQYNNRKMIIGIGHINSQHSVITMKYAVTDTASGVVTDFGFYSSVDSPSVWTLPALL